MLPIPETSDWSSSARLSAGPPAAERGRERRVVEGRVQRVAGDVRDRRRDLAAGRPGQRLDREPAEGALVDVAQLAAAVGEAQPGAQVRAGRLAGRQHQQLAAHAEMAEQRRAAGLPGDAGGGQRQPQVLAAPARAQHGPAEQPRDHVVRAGEVPAGGARVQHLRGGHRPAGDPPVQAAADDLDLGQLRHADTVCVPPEVGRRAGVRGDPREARTGRGRPPGGHGLIRRARRGCAPAARSRRPRPPSARPPSCCGRPRWRTTRRRPGRPR